MSSSTILVFLSTISHVISLCPDVLKVNITQAVKYGEDNIVFENITFTKDQYFIRDGDTWGCPCLVKDCIRKCCPITTELSKSSEGQGQCLPSYNQTFNINIYEQTTPVDVNISDFFMINGMDCPKGFITVLSTDIYIQKDGTLFDDNNIYYTPNLYCVDYYNDRLIGLTCNEYRNGEEIDYWHLIPYFTVIVSMICFATTAVIYRLILKENNIIKKTIIIFSSSMCLVFLSLIILNVQSNLPTCRVFGFFFLTLTIFSFIWLCISCFELFYLVKVPLEGKQQEQRWYWYIGVSSGISILILVVSLFSGELWVPDIPDTFIRHSGNCQFSVEFSRILILFVPMALSIILSLTFIIISTRLIQKNENQQEIRNNYYWVQNRYNYKFMCRTYMVIIFASLFWFAHLFYNGHQTQLALDVLEGAFGILTLTTFVLNKYTCKDIANRFKKTTHITEQTLELTDISTPTTPELEQDPFLHQNHNNHNANNSSYNNR